MSRREIVLWGHCNSDIFFGGGGNSFFFFFFFFRVAAQQLTRKTIPMTTLFISFIELGLYAFQILKFNIFYCH